MGTSQPVALDSIAPFFVVSNVRSSATFYERLGFKLSLLLPEDDPFFAIVRRRPVAVILKEIGPDIAPAPNHTLHEWARWGALIYTRERTRYSRSYLHGVAIHCDMCAGLRRDGAGGGRE